MLLAPPFFDLFRGLCFIVFLLIVVRGDRRHLEILAVEATFFCTWNWLTLAGRAMKKSRLRCGCEFGPFWYGKFWELKSWTYRPNGVRNLFKIDKNLENITKTAPQIDEKSRLRFWSVFGAALGRQLGGTTLRFWDPKIPKQSQKEPKGHQKWAKGRPKSIKKFAPGPLAAHRRGVLTLEVSAVYLSSMHPFPAVGLVFAVFFFFLGGFHPGSLPFPPLSVVFWSPFGALLVESGLSCFRYVFLECFWTIFDAFLTSFGG